MSQIWVDSKAVDLKGGKERKWNWSKYIEFILIIWIIIKGNPGTWVQLEIAELLCYVSSGLLHPCGWDSIQLQVWMGRLFWWLKQITMKGTKQMGEVTASLVGREGITIRQKNHEFEERWLSAVIHYNPVLSNNTQGNCSFTNKQLFLTFPPPQCNPI